MTADRLDNPKADAWRALYPFASHFITVDGHRIHYLDEGQGPVLLLVHGNPTWSFYWREVVKAFRGRYRVVVPDHVGCGLSDKPEPKVYPYRLTRRISDLRAVVEQLGLEDVTLVAHDWGGAIGLGTAAAIPERFGRFVLLNTAAFLSKRIPWRIRLCHTPILGRLAIQGLNLFAQAATRMTVCRPLAPAVRAGLLAPYDSWVARAAIFEFVHDIPLSPEHPSYTTLRDIEQALPGLADKPVCLIWGMRDWCFDAHFLNRFVDFFPQAQAHRLEGAGHYVVEDAPGEVIATLEQFLEGQPPDDAAPTD